MILSGREGNWPEHSGFVLAELENLRRVVEFLASRELATQNAIHDLTGKVSTLMAAIDDLSAQVDAADDKLDALAAIVPQLQSTIVSLQQQLANAPNDSDALAQLTAKLKQHTDAAAAVLSPPAPEAEATN